MAQLTIDILREEDMGFVEAELLGEAVAANGNGDDAIETPRCDRLGDDELTSLIELPFRGWSPGARGEDGKSPDLDFELHRLELPDFPHPPEIPVTLESVEAEPVPGQRSDPDIMTGVVRYELDDGRC